MKFFEGNKRSSSVNNESLKSPSQSSDICNNEAQHYVDFDVNLSEKHGDVQKKYKLFNNFCTRCAHT